MFLRETNQLKKALKMSKRYLVQQRRKEAAERKENKEEEDEDSKRGKEGEREKREEEEERHLGQHMQW